MGKINIRKTRVRNKIRAKGSRVRLVVQRSNKNTYGQIVDDAKGITLLTLASSKLDKKATSGKTKTQVAEILGAEIAKIAKSKKIKQIVFDRSGYKYHGRVKALAEAARKEGLEF